MTGPYVFLLLRTDSWRGSCVCGLGGRSGCVTTALAAMAKILGGRRARGAQEVVRQARHPRAPATQVRCQDAQGDVMQSARCVGRAQRPPEGQECTVPDARRTSAEVARERAHIAALEARAVINACCCPDSSSVVTRQQDGDPRSDPKVAALVCCCTSNAPTSHIVPPGRSSPRWSSVSGTKQPATHGVNRRPPVLFASRVGYYAGQSASQSMLP